MEPLKGAVIGCGFFARNHLNAWAETPGVLLAAVCDQDGARAREAAALTGAGRCYTDAAEMLSTEALDFVDVVTQPASHRSLVELAAAHRVHAVCQKPLAPSLEDARAMVGACRAAGVRFMVHENFRWQAPMRALKEAAAGIGDLFFGRIVFRSAHDCYSKQPYLATDPRFIIYDLGVHLLDLARFFLGEVEALCCHARRVNPRIRAEDAATMLLRMRSGATAVVEMSYASKLEVETFPQTLVHLEGTRGSATLGPGYVLTTTIEGESTRRTVPIRRFPWSTPPHDAIQESVAAIQAHWAECLRAGREPETSGEDNLKTLELVFGSYESSATGAPYRPGQVLKEVGT
jgi:predicted dehydrogenase